MSQFEELQREQLRTPGSLQSSAPGGYPRAFAPPVAAFSPPVALESEAALRRGSMRAQRHDFQAEAPAEEANDFERASAERERREREAQEQMAELSARRQAAERAQAEMMALQASVGAGSTEHPMEPGGWAPGDGEGGDMNEEDMLGPDGQQLPLSIREARRMRKGIETNANSIENRIKFFKREEEKIWRDLEEVRRQAAKIEDGRSRTLEKKLADKAISQVREELLSENKHRVRTQKQVAVHNKSQKAEETQDRKRMASDQQRRESKEILDQKRKDEAQSRLHKSEKVITIQNGKLEAKMEANRQKLERIAQLRNEQEVGRIDAVNTVQQVESRLPALEAEEMECLQRLQNSRYVTQTVLQELEVSLGSRSAVTSLLRSKAQRGAGVSAAVGGMSGSFGGDVPMSGSFGGDLLRNTVEELPCEDSAYCS